MQRIWLALTPIMFLILWSAGYVVAKVALVDAAPLALLAMIRASQVSHVSTLLFLVLPLAVFITGVALDEPMPLMAWAGLIVSGFEVYLATRHRKSPD